MTRSIVTIAFAAALAVAASGCAVSGAAEADHAGPSALEGNETTSAEPHASSDDHDEHAHDASSHHYSPFAVRVTGMEQFDIVTFKDVTSGVDNPDLLTYELLAETLAAVLQEDPDLELASHVIFAEELRDPANHMSCELEHLYVDVWRSEGPDRWGFSLWSGCGEDDNFAWDEVPAVVQDGMEDLRPLAEGIAASLQTAVETGCFRAEC